TPSDRDRAGHPRPAPRRSRPPRRMKMAQGYGASIDFYVLVNVTDRPRDFYVVPGDDLRSGMDERHQEFMSRVGGVRPRNPDSRHTAIYPAQVETWRNQWSLFAQAAQPASKEASSWSDSATGAMDADSSLIRERKDDGY
ncbi:hypothetical protein, partial [Micromonospora aurantiaca]|uniref:hypothetical protein n=1 Tax=Micromonospora aurantiaca (nom. illeg.) TaxID=47850 RepID=UPI00197B3C19